MIPLIVRRHLDALGVGDAGAELIEKDMVRAQAMTREELKAAIERKNQAIRILRVEQAVFLAVLGDMP